MSILDELKQQAEQLRQAQEQDTETARREALYQEKLKPGLKAILNYLEELTEQLKAVNPAIHHDYTLPGLGLLKGLRQRNYTLKADTKDQTKVVRLKFNCVADKEQTFAVTPQSQAIETRSFLESQKMRYTEWPIRDNSQQIVVNNFQLQASIEIYITFQADLEMGAIKMATTNFKDFVIDRSTVLPQRINDQWLDHLGHYILRKNENLYCLEIDESSKESIRMRLEAEKRARQEDLQRAIKREKLEREEKERTSLLGKLKNLRKR